MGSVNLPSYYAVIPASVRYDARLCANAKLLFGEITALSSKEGFCWATNRYFSELYGVGIATISEWVSQLEKSGHIKTKVLQQYRRKIWLEGVPLREKPKVASGKAEGGASGKAEESIPSPITTTSEDVGVPTVETTLYQKIWKAFLSKNDDKFSDYAKEGKATHGLIKKAKAREGDNAEALVGQMIHAFWKLRCNGDKFWSGQPFTPSALNASGIWDRVLETLRNKEKMVDPVAMAIARREII